jgi:hypothetical protein
MMNILGNKGEGKMWHIDPFLGSNHETNNETAFTARQQILIRIDGCC